MKLLVYGGNKMEDHSKNMKTILEMIERGELSPEDGYHLIEQLENTQSQSGDFQSVVLTKPGHIEDLQLKTSPPTKLGEDEVKILVKAFSLNFGDLLCVKGLYPTMPEYPFIPGFEVSGIVMKVGANVTRVQPGDEVIGLMGNSMGGQSSIVTTDEHLVVKKPSNVSHEEAAAFPIVFTTMYHIYELANVRKGDKVLIQTAAGGIGLIAVQLAQFIGAECYATAGSQKKLDYLRSLGVDHLINYREEDFATKIEEMTNGEGIDVVINTLAGDAIQKGLNILASGGRYIEIAMTGLKTAHRIDLSHLVDNQNFHSVDLRRLLAEHPELIKKYLDTMSHVLASGTVKPTVGKVLPMSKIKQAYQWLDERENIGKVVVVPETGELASELIPAYKEDQHEETEEQITSHQMFADDEEEDSYLFKTQDKQTNETKDIAIIGISCRMPGATNVNEFWSNIANGVSSIEEVPSERWSVEDFYDPDPSQLHKTNSKWGGYLKGIDRFDAFFFNMSGKEAELADPQQRIFLEESWSALEDAGYANNDLSDKKCAVFAGVGHSDYMMNMNKDIEPQSLWGTESSILPARISYFLNLKGPSVTVNTACSSSLVSIHLGCQSILNGDSDMALAGGVFISNTPYFHIAASNAGMLSPDGTCKTFDQTANGFVPGEGAGVVVLKSLEAAKRDGDHIYGVIKGSGINQDGKTNGITAPSTLSQTELERSVYKKAGVHPEDISYIESHGTGTKLGDPIEIEALTNAFREFTDKKEYCAIGSVKTNIGHTSAAAGVASVIKVLMALKYRQLPPSLNCDEYNEHIDFANSPFFVNKKIREWKREINQPLLAAVSSFGFSGTNAHLLIEEPPKLEVSGQRYHLQPETSYLIPISAKTDNSLAQRVSDLLVWIEEQIEQGETIDLANLSYTLGKRRGHFSNRVVWVVRNLHDLQTKLQSFDPTIDVSSSKPSVRHHDYKQLQLLLKTVKQNGVLNEEEFVQLAEFYHNGHSIDWDVIYDGDHYRSISLPTYPFDRERYWRDDQMIGEQENHRPYLHPLIEKNTSTLSEQRFSTQLTGKEFYLADHHVKGSSVLPAAAYMEIARAAGELSNVYPIKKLRNLFWIQPFIRTESEDVTQELHISLFPEQAGVIDFEVYSGQTNSGTLHVQGTIHDDQSTEAVQKEVISLSDIKSHCKRTRHWKDLYEWFAKQGLHYGETFQTIREFYVGEKEALAYLSLPNLDSLRGEAYHLHPSLLDGALQTLMGMMNDQQWNESHTYLPFALDTLEIHHPVQSNCYAYATQAQDDPTKYNIQLVDEHGKILVHMRHLAVRKLTTETISQPLDLLLYKSSWETKSLSTTFDDQMMYVEGDVLIFDTDDTFYNEWVMHHRQRTDQTLRPVLVKPGRDFKDLGDDQYVINPTDRKHYEQLVTSLKDKHIRPTYILHRWSHNRGAGDGEKLHTILQTSIYSLFHMMQAFLHQHPQDAISVLYSHTSDPAHVAVSSWLKTLAIEHSNIHYKCIELIDQAIPLTTWLHECLSIKSESEQIIRYADGKRSALTLNSHDLSIVDQPNNQSILRAGGVYMIVGGMGGLGLTLANYLAAHFQAKLILVGRTPLSAEKKDLIKELKNLGAEVMYQQADTANEEDIESLIKDVKKTFGVIHGVIHSAGVLRDGLFLNKSFDDMETVLDAKVKGTMLLDQATRDERLDFFVLFSSLASIVSNVGQSDYAYANGFLDGYAVAREKRRGQGKCHGQTITFNWPAWQTDGMQLDPVVKQMMKKQGLYPLTEKIGVNVFERVLATRQGGQWIVLNGEKEKLKQILNKQHTKTNISDIQEQVIEQNERKQPTTLYQSDLQDYLVQILADESRIPTHRINVDEAFETYGIDSAMIVNLTRELEHDFGELSKTLFFEYQTIEEISAYFMREHNDQLHLMFGANQISSDVETGQHQSSDDQVTIETKDRGEFKQRRHRFKRETLPQTTSQHRQTKDPVAIIGLSGRYPMADTMEQFWENLKKGQDCVTEVPTDRRHEESGKNFGKWGGFINDVDTFDPLFFNISPLEAELMDPQERLFLQTVWHSIEDAGYTHTALKNSRTGVFVGVMYGQYQLFGAHNALTGEGFVPSSSYASIANRVSYVMDWNGPSMAIDTMCSSSLTALHLACKSIQEGEADTAIAGGVNVTIHPYKHHLLGQSNFISSDGRCRSFGEGGDGYVPGEGVGSVLLKPLSKAIEDGDQIYAVIKGSALNHGGKTNGYTVPNPNAQASVIEDALQRAEINAEHISYIEAHGTGTALGDPIEVTGLTKAYRKLTSQDQFCAIGSVKSNIGHAESAAGIAGITKVLLQMKYRQLVPSLHAEQVNPNINFDDTPFYLQREMAEWEPLDVVGRSTSIPRMAAVSSFGAGGSNAHIILEEFQSDHIRHGEGPLDQVFILSAKQQESLQSYAQHFRDSIRDASPNDIHRIAYTLQTGREAMDDRLAIVASNLEELAEKLDEYLEGYTTNEGIYAGQRQDESILNVFSGQTAQEVVQSMMAKKESSEIAKLWASGLEVDWNLLYPIEKPQRISLPVYPFKKERYWVDMTKDIEATEASIKERVTLESRISEPLSTNKPINSELTDEELRNHVISDIKQIAAQLIKIESEKLQINENLGNYGFDSVALKELSEQLSSTYKVDILPTIFFEKGDIKGIAEYMLEEFMENIQAFYQINNSEHDTQSNQMNKNDNESDTRLLSHKKKITSNEPIAIVGMSGMFPQSKDLDEYWQNLINGKDMITPVPEDRWNWKDFSNKDSKLYSTSSWGGFIDDVDKFDPRFFSISPFEAEMIDPQQRLALQTVWKTIEDAGYKASEYSGRNVGLFIGAQFQDYLQLLHDDGQFNAQMGTGNELSILVNRISYLLNFHGPSEPYNTACSSSSVAIHRAVQSIRSGESEVAIAGGISLMLAPYGMISASQMGILSPEGRCKTLSADADGYVKGEGVGMLMLKPLSQAIADRDHIYSVIKGTAVNHGGKANSLTAPNSEAQANVLTAAYEQAGFDPETIDYIELHGTGTELGDPVEIEGIKKAFKQLAQNQGKNIKKQKFCGIGSVKTNIGHLEPASGIAGIMKVILAMRHKQHPGILHLEKVNPYVRLENSPFYIVDKPQPWDRAMDQMGNETPRRAGISSFGFGGVNAHIALEEYEDIPSDPSDKTYETNEKKLFVFSAKNEERLLDYANKFLDFVEKETTNANVTTVHSKDFRTEIIQIISKIIHVNPQELDVFEAFEEYGFGPVHLNELFQEITKKYNIHIQPSMKLLNEYSTVAALADYLQMNSEIGISDVNSISEEHHHMLTQWAFTLQVGREEMNTRMACVAATPQELISKLRNFIHEKGDIHGLYQGEITSNAHLEQLSPEQQAYVDELLQTKSLYELAEKWITGETIHWGKMYTHQSIQRVPLTTYPFAKERYWAPKAYSTENRHQTEPLQLEGQDHAATRVENTGEKEVSQQNISHVLKEVLGEKLKLDPNEIEEDVELSEYGVDSMLSSMIMQIVEERFGELMDANVIEEYPTIAGLSDYILKEINPKEISSSSTHTKSARKPKYPQELVPINTKGTKQVSFWFHGATGYSTVFRNLSNIIGPDYPMYAFQARGVDGKTMPQTFDEMVEHYYNCIRMIQPNGPYFFGGYSFGGLIAMEVARRLKSEGEVIQHLIMFDSYPPTDDVNEHFYGTYDFDFLKLFLVNAFLKSDEKPELLITNGDIQDVPKRLQVSHLAKIAKEKSGTLIETDEIFNFIKGGMLVSDYAEEAYADYRPDPYDASHVTFFKTTEGFVSDDNIIGIPGVNILDNYDYSTYWEEMVKKDLDVYTVECDHNSILEEPILSEVAPKVLHLLEECSSLNNEKSASTSPVQDYAVLLQTFQGMGVFLEAGETYKKEELLEKLALPQVYTSLFTTWIESLASEGYITVKNDDIITTDEVVK